MIAVIQVINQILPDLYQIPFCFLVDHIIFCPCCNDGLLCTIGLSGNTVDLFIGGMDLYLGSKLLVVLYILILICSFFPDGTVIPDVRKSFVDITYSCTDSQCGRPIWVIRLFYIPCQIAGFVFTLVSRSRVVKLQAALIIMKIFWNGHGDHNIRCLTAVCYQFMILCSTGDLQPWHYHEVCCTFTVGHIIIGLFPVGAFDQVCILNADSTDQRIQKQRISCHPPHHMGSVFLNTVLVFCFLISVKSKITCQKPGHPFFKRSPMVIFHTLMLLFNIIPRLFPP